MQKPSQLKNYDTVQAARVHRTNSASAMLLATLQGGRACVDKCAARDSVLVARAAGALADTLVGAFS